MCTLTWFVKDGGYELFFNRDERTSRRHAGLPSVHSYAGITYISPTDADAGGTWIAANHFGVTVCLLNHYQFEQIATYKKWISRGEIVRQFATTENLDLAQQQFLQLDFEDYRAFRMFLIDRQGNNCLCVWDGHKPRVELNVDTPKSSSSVDAKHVKAIRKQLFSDNDLPQSKDSMAYLKFHSSHIPNNPIESVCMHRADANTVSLSHVDVGANGIKFAYADGAPCDAKLAEPLQIMLFQCEQTQKPDSEASYVVANR